jgi:tetratricopeptide (TPR) repeat protein
MAGWIAVAPAMAVDTPESWVSKIVSLQGEVLVKRTGQNEWRPAALDDLFYPGDALRVAANSRAALVLSNEALLRLDQLTTLVFTGIEKPKSFLMELLEGAAYLFCRKSRSLKIKTPYVNGVVEGTEFLVRVSSDRTTISLYEGAVRAENDAGALAMAKGQSVEAVAGEAPRYITLVRPRDALQWSLYYPPVALFNTADFAGTEGWQADVRRSLAEFQAGRIIPAFAAIAGWGETVADARFLAYRAALRLAVGRVTEAGMDIERALALDSRNAPALALRAVMAVARNDKKSALADGRAAVDSAPRLAAARIAYSYAFQSRFDLAAAAEQVEEAVSAEPQNGLAWARLAELRLSLGDQARALNAGLKAADLAPNLAQAHTVLGFVHLMRIDTAQALESFRRAVRLDSAAPLPRLGLGLAKIREGDLEAGRAEIEISAALDPDNALIRSYLGKAYFDEKREGLDERQLEMAKALDPNDPTPWFYDAIRKQAENRPGEALRDMQKAIELNDNRAVYRSRLMLDDDLAARSAALGRIYSDLSFQELALSQGWRSLEADPANASAHRLLSDMYASRPRHQIARVSELLQAQLLQPLSLTPFQPQSAEAMPLVIEGGGPSALGLNEFHPLFTRDRVALTADGLAGSNATYADDLIVSGVEKKVAFSAGQSHYESIGFRQNNDINQNIYDVFAQAAVTPQLSLQTEYRYKETDAGDLDMLFDPDIFLPNKRSEDRVHSLRLGANYQTDPAGNLLASLIYRKTDNELRDRLDIADPFMTTAIDSESSYDSEAYSAELQYLRRAQAYSIVAGGGYLEIDRTDDLALTTTMTIPPLPPSTTQDLSSTDYDTRHTNGYLYLYLKAVENLTLTLAGAYDVLQGKETEANHFSPKAGLVWSPHRSLSFRASWFRTIKRFFNADQTLEPTQIAGFNQFFDDYDGARTERYGAAVDAVMAKNLFSGLEFSWRKVDTPRYDATLNSTTTEDDRERSHRAYIYWSPLERLSLSVEGYYEKYERSIAPNEVLTYRFPISIGYFHSNGFFGKVVTTYVDQEVMNHSIEEEDQFWVTDAFIGFKMPRRLGLVSFGVRNLFDQEFNYQDLNFNSSVPTIPLFQPERMIFVRISFSL